MIQILTKPNLSVENKQDDIGRNKNELLSRQKILRYVLSPAQHFLEGTQIDTTAQIDTTGVDEEELQHNKTCTILL